MCSPLSRLARIRRAELRPIARWAIRAFVALLPVGQYGLLSRYCPPCGGAIRAPARLCARRCRGLRAYAVSNCALLPVGQYGLLSPYCPLGNTGFCRPIARWAIRAFIALQGNATIATPNVESTARFRSIHEFDRRHRSHRQCRRPAHRVGDSSNDR